MQRALAGRPSSRGSRGRGAARATAGALTFVPGSLPVPVACANPRSPLLPDRVARLRSPAHALLHATGSLVVGALRAVADGRGIGHQPGPPRARPALLAPAAVHHVVRLHRRRCSTTPTFLPHYVARLCSSIRREQPDRGVLAVGPEQQELALDAADAASADVDHADDEPAE